MSPLGRPKGEFPRGGLSMDVSPCLRTGERRGRARRPGRGQHAAPKGAT
jgi:hypothetical protein